MTGYWPSSFLCVQGRRRSRQVHKLAKKGRGQYPAILTEQTRSIKDLLYGFRVILLTGYSGQSRAGKMAPSCPLGQPITARDLGHLARSRSQPYNNKAQSPCFRYARAQGLTQAHSKTQILMCHYHHSLSIDATIMVSKNCPITVEHGIISAWLNFFLLWNFNKQNEIQLLAKFKQILYQIVLLQQTITWYKFRHVGGQAYYYSRNGTLKQRDLNQSSLTGLLF